jgi:hypothetical protein
MSRAHKGIVIAGLLMSLLATASADEPTVVWNQRPQPWSRRADPILSAHTTKQTWCQVVCYSPHVIEHDGKFRMWYLGTSIASRTNDMAMGYAESQDGIHWTEHPANPILRGDDIPWGKTVQTPYVLWDEDDRIYKLWFVSGDGILRDANNKIIQNDQQLGYATSKDGIHWEIHPRPIFPSARSPAVIKESATSYRMWMGSRPDVTDRASADLYSHIYEFKSTDGIRWRRAAEPTIQPSGSARTTVYPFVLKDASGYVMWYGCHLAGGKFEIFSATSTDGTRWELNHEQPAFGAAPRKDRFDSRYTSTPCIVRSGDRTLLYYSARDLQNEYRDGQGKLRRDSAGVYAHIGVAELP